jgi:hypothetical protein
MATKRSNGRQTYGSAHRNLKKRLLADLRRRPGQPCERCGYPMTVEMELHLDHAPGGGYLGLSHASCNMRAGQQITTAILRERNWQPPARSQRAISRKQGRRAAGEAAGWPSSRRW